RILSAHGFGYGKGFGGNADEVQIQVAGYGLERAEVHHGREGIEELNGDILALETDRVSDAVAVDLDVDNGGIYELHFEFFVAGFPGELLARALEGPVLD